MFFHPSLLMLFLDPGWTIIRIRDKISGSARLGKGFKEYIQTFLMEAKLFNLESACDGGPL